MLSFSVLSFRHSGWLPLFSASENSVLDRDRFEVAVGSVDDKGGDTEESIYSGQGTGMNTTDLEIGIVVEVDPVGMSLGELGEGNCFLELVTEFVGDVFMFLVKEVEAFSSPRVGGGGIVVVSDGAAYDGQLFLRISIVETRLGAKVFGRGTGGFSLPNDRLLWWWSLFGSFLSELERNGVVDVIRWGRSSSGRCQR